MVKTLLPQILLQTKSRVLDGKYVPSNEKVVSIFEGHTDIIVKGRREVEFGHKVFLTAGKTGLILDCKVAEGNPSDSAQFQTMIKRQIEVFGRSPRQTTADGGFASKKNVEEAKEKMRHVEGRNDKKHMGF